MDDIRIIDLYFARSEQAIQETDLKYGAYLNQVAYNILRSMGDTEEIVNDTYLGAWNAMPPTRPNVLRHFLSRITRNLSFNRLNHMTAKKRCPHGELLLSELNECVPDRRGSVEEIWEAKQIGDSLNRFLGTLDESVCGVFLARYYYARTVNEIANTYKLPERRIKYLLTRTRTQLKKHLEKDGVVI